MNVNNYPNVDILSCVLAAVQIANYQRLRRLTTIETATRVRFGCCVGLEKWVCQKHKYITCR